MRQPVIFVTSMAAPADPFTRTSTSAARKDPCYVTEECAFSGSGGWRISGPGARIAYIGAPSTRAMIACSDRISPLHHRHTHRRCALQPAQPGLVVRLREEKQHVRTPCRGQRTPRERGACCRMEGLGCGHEKLDASWFDSRKFGIELEVVPSIGVVEGKDWNRFSVPTR